MKIIKTDKLTIKAWLEDLEPGALRQAKNLANFPFAFSHIAIMSDAHQGYGMPIGGVMATEGVIVPNAVGLDIGCGVRALKTNLLEINRDSLKKIGSEIKKVIPLGFKRYQQAQAEELMPDLAKEKIIKRQYQAARYQLASLGGGNHFIEVQLGSDGHIWLMVHSGSRNLGKQVADYYNWQAIKLNQQLGASLPSSWQLAYLPLNHKLGHDYILAMNYCRQWAVNNRKLMTDKILTIFNQVLKNKGIRVEQEIDVAHNYASEEEHFSKKVIVHRKGATLAGKNTIGLIPGSQGMCSYVVLGKGNPASFNSCSHGAGRQMSRQQARQKLDLKTERAKLDKMGVLHCLAQPSDLDEAAGAYKEIKTVISQQADLVEVLIELRPLMVIKA